MLCRQRSTPVTPVIKTFLLCFGTYGIRMGLISRKKEALFLTMTKVIFFPLCVSYNCINSKVPKTNHVLPSVGKGLIPYKYCHACFGWVH